MGKRRDFEPSPLRTGIVHAALSLGLFGGLAALLGVGVQLSGDPSDASPRQTLALFDTNPDATPILKARLRNFSNADTLVAGGADLDAYDAESGDEPDLGVDYAEAPAIVTDLETVTEQGSASAAGGIRINGKLVRPGESYGEIATIISLPKAPLPGLTETVNGLALPRVAADGRAPADAYARPFANPAKRPVVSLVVGGLGINRTHTQSAIDELPPEVTLSFAPDAARLQTWITKARAAGHEVMIEVPMETFDYGRMKMHPETLLASAEPNVNAARLDKILSRATGYFGVINYQGAKFASSESAARPVLETLSQRGIALVEDGSLSDNAFSTIADQSGLRYASAAAPIDTKLTADDINSQLMELETLSQENGAAIGTGYAFPITIEMIKIWTDSLEGKGIVLAPVSAQTGIMPASMVEGGRVRTGSLAVAPLNPEG